jgi:hypothetical protein
MYVGMFVSKRNTDESNNVNTGNSVCMYYVHTFIHAYLHITWVCLRQL